MFNLKFRLSTLLIKSDVQYYNLGEPIFSDDEYDEIKDYLKTIDKKNELQSPYSALAFSRKAGVSF